MPAPKRRAAVAHDSPPSKKTKRTAAPSEAAETVTPRISPRKAKPTTKSEALSDSPSEDPEEHHGTKTKAPSQVNSVRQGVGESQKQTKGKRTRVPGKGSDTMPLAARTSGLRMFVGAHVSGAGGVHNAVENATHIGANAFALFMKSQRKWANPPLKDEHRDLFLEQSKQMGYDAAKHVLPHGSYLVNLAQEEEDKAKQAYDSFVDDLKRCDALGIRLYNFHPGNTGSRPRADAIARIAKAINRAHKETGSVVAVLENMAGGGNVVGSTFEDLRDMIAQIEDKKRVGICLDTCHTFAAGYDLRTPEAFKATLDSFDQIVGMRYLRALHLNDSKAPLGSHRDLHFNIGLGFLGLRAFHSVMNEKRFEDLPMVLETPIDHKDANGKTVEDKSVWSREIKLLESLIGMDAESDEFKKLEKELASKGVSERDKLQEQVNRKAEKDGKKKGRMNTKRGAKGKETESEAESTSE